MSDMKLYKILETFDELESATDKLTPVTEEDVNEEEVDESQTKVQTMGNKVKVTTDGDTTEFDDKETAAEFVDASQDDENSINQFATESEEEDEEVIDEEAEEVVDEDAEEIAEGGLGGDEWDAAGDALEFGAFDEPYNEVPSEFGDLEVPVFDPDASDLGIDADAAFDELGESGDCMEDESEFATFDSENESHRKRLQRGTPVVLDPELFTDSDVDRRGIFVSRSPGGDFAKVVRDFDGKEIKVHLSDIKSADLVNNSVYEEYDINLEAMLAEDITMTQTTNMEQPENDTTTVTAVGAEAGEELAAMMANAGLNGGMHQDAEVVDLGEPEAPVAEPGMQDMIGMIDGPEEIAQEAFGDDELPPMYTPDDEMDVEPSNADLDQIETDDEFDLDFNEATGEVSDQGVPIHRPMSRDEAMKGNHTTELETILGKFDSSDILAWLEDGHEGIDEALYAISMEDMPYGTQKGRTGDPIEWLYNQYGEEIEAYAKDNFGSHLGEAGRDIEHANTPDERIAGVDMVTHGTSGGLNRPKTMHKPAAGGDNAMQRPMEDMYEEELAEELSPENKKKNDALLAQMKAERGERRYKGSRLTGHRKNRDMSISTEYESLGEAEEKKEWKKPWEKDEDEQAETNASQKEEDKYKEELDDEASGKKEEVEETFVNEHESVDNFLDMYKEFRIRTEKK